MEKMEAVSREQEIVAALKEELESVKLVRMHCSTARTLHVNL